MKLPRDLLPWAMCLAVASPVWAQNAAPSVVKKLDDLLGRPGGLRANEVAQRAIETSFSLKEKVDQVNEAAAQVEQARLAWVPRLGVKASYFRLSPVTPEVLANVLVSPGATPGLLPPGSPIVSVPISIAQPNNATTFQGVFTVPLTEYLWHVPELNKAASESARAAQLMAQAAKLQQATEAQVAYFAWVKAKLQTVVAQQALEQAKQHRERAKRAFASGIAPRVDLLRVEAQVAAAEQFVNRTSDLEAVLEEQLRTLMHVDDEVHFDIGEDLREVLPPLDLPAHHQLLDEALAQRLEVQAVTASVRGSEAQVQVARSAAIPSLALVAEATEANPNTRYFPPKQRFDFSWSAGAVFSYTINDTLVATASGKQAEARAASLKNKLGGVRDQLRSEVAQSVQVVRDADGSVSAAARGLEAAEAAMQSRQDQYEQGKATDIELTDAETESTQSGLNFITALVDQRLGRVRLFHALGRDVESGESK